MVLKINSLPICSVTVNDKIHNARELIPALGSQTSLIYHNVKELPKEY